MITLTSRSKIVLVAIVLTLVVCLAIPVAANYTREDRLARPEKPAASKEAVSAVDIYAGSDWIERHPSVVRPANYYAGSDWIERHPSAVRPANYYAGSDWIERHPSAVRPANYYAGSDWIERHPGDGIP